MCMSMKINKRIISAILFFCMIALSSFAQSIYDWVEVAESGDSEAMFQVGQCYQHGIEVASDGAKAAEWYLKAAKKGHVEAMYLLGSRTGFYDDGGKLSEKDRKKWLKKAADNYHPQALAELGWDIFNTSSKKSDWEKAYQMFMTAADLGESYAYWYLAQMYLSRRGDYQRFYNKQHAIDMLELGWARYHDERLLRELQYIRERL